jgi:hypothetical protein
LAPTTSTTNTATTLPPTTTTLPSTTTTFPPTTTTMLPATPIAFAAGERVRIVITGDSLTMQWIPHLIDMLGDAAEVVKRAYSGTALCDWFERQGDDLGLEHLADWRPHVFVVDHGGNAFTDCMVDHEGADYLEKYRVDSGYVIELAARTDTRVLFLSQPVSRTDLAAGTHDVFAALPEAFPDGLVRYASTWPVLSPDGHFIQDSACATHEPGCIDGRGLLRSPPPGGHLEPLGAWRYALLVADELVTAGWLPADAVSRG